MTRLTIALVLIFVAACERQEPVNGEVIATAKATVTASAIRAHMEFLAADELAGRETGSAGHLTAAEYVADAFRDAGLQPLGDGGTYLQAVPLLETRLVEDSAQITLRLAGRSIELELGEDFARSGGFGASTEELTAPLLFVGYGITALEYDHDDYSGLDARGRVLVVLSGAPAHFATDERAYYSSRSYKSELANRMGALGLVTVRTPVDQERIPWSRDQEAIGSADMHWTGEDGRPSAGWSAGLPGDAILSTAGAGKLFGMAGHSIERIFEEHATGAVGGLDLGITATIARKSRQRHTSSPNVLALLPGRGPLSRESLVFTAHLDHLGVRPGTGTDRIYNGAYDNAAGVAIMLEVAKGMAAANPESRRAVIFVAFTAEEKGLQGSDYFIEHPPIPLERIVATINIDMPYFGFPIADVEAFGVEHSTLKESLTHATAAEGLEWTPDSRPELVRFIRSDQYSFVRQGIPGLNLKPGSKSADPAFNGDQMLRAFLSNHYHEPSDDLTQPFDPGGAERFGRAAVHFALLVATALCPPAWNPGDFFERTFARDARRHSCQDTRR